MPTTASPQSAMITDSAAKTTDPPAGPAARPAASSGSWPANR